VVVDNSVFYNSKWLKGHIFLPFQVQQWFRWYADPLRYSPNSNLIEVKVIQVTG
jgi:hypothetical protein